MKRLHKESFKVGRNKVIQLMEALNLKVEQRVAFEVTSKQDPSHAVADNLVNMDFNPKGMNQVWVGDITYLKTAQG